MDLNQLSFTRRAFRSESIIYSGYMFGHNAVKFRGGGLFELSKIDRDTVVVNPSDGIIDLSRVPENTEVSFASFEYPNQEIKILIAYGPNINSTSRAPCFTSILKDSIRLLSPNINKDGPGARVGISIKRSKYNIWAFGGYPGVGGTGSIPGRYFFFFNGTSNNWIDKTDLAINENIPNLVYHTMSNINDEYLIVIGGGTYNSQGILVDKPFDKVYKFDLNKETWSTTSLVNCPKNTKIGHTTTMVNGSLIVIGGTDNQQESKLNIYPDIISIDPSTLKCTNINIKYDSGASANIKSAFHAANYIDNYLLINSGMREPDYDNQQILIDTSTWTRKFKFKNIDLMPTPDSNSPNNKPISNTNTIIYSVVGVVLFLTLASFLYYFFIIRKQKKRDLNNIQISNGQVNNQEPDVKWVRSDSKIIRLDNEEVFSFDDKATASKNIEADRDADLRQLNILNFVYKNDNFSNQGRVNNKIQEFPETFTNATLLSKENIAEENTLTS
ncbi:hypothetical protein CONCODRAFT_9868 [Conidiobolus coronatus NRRL 28638]|uniref:Galactose oxidase n=1 Tax=Conidiobolus coronatus (strain ATCC 28846 / CBS 209.66 / NRRL 28638) TaxID=796925 RepID=A0A137NYQ5_CONC2|nr:hypothetical protein CONCODRAFT_9868 [Conidiobolus coronatus NRRL 28638]|eukprot:KXN67970.1 hypothetical protein CONCODRAFT_9868 [Conidiobolus coronatus NRRL 28638]